MCLLDLMTLYIVSCYNLLVAGCNYTSADRMSDKAEYFLIIQVMDVKSFKLQLKAIFKNILRYF